MQLTLLRSLRYAAPLAVLWSVPIVAIAILQMPARSQESAALGSKSVATVTVGERQQDLTRGVKVEFTLGPRSRVLANGSGLITSVYAISGAGIVEGTSLAEVDGVGVIANRGQRPFYRDLTIGSVGEDVTQLSALLGSVGIPARVKGDLFTVATQQAVRELQNKLGASPDGVFRPTYAWYVPEAFGTIDTVLVSPGDRISDSTVTFNARPRAISATISAENQGDSLSAYADKPISLAAGATILDVSGLSLTGDAADGLLHEVVAAGQSPQDVGPTASEQLSAVYVGLSLKLRNTETLGAVPRSAIYTSPSGASCVFTVPDAAAPEAVRSVDIPVGFDGGFEVAAALVPPGLVGSRIVVDANGLSAETKTQCS